MKDFIITLDGPAGVGKSSLAQAVAEEMNLSYMDSGAMFRILAFELGPEALDMSDSELESRLQAFRFSVQGAGKNSVMCCNGRYFGDEIRSEEVAALASRLGANAVVRAFLCGAQRDVGMQSSLVCEGRDMGSVIFPHALCKFFLDATPEERARRRSRQLESQGKIADYSTILDQILTRDAKDRNRKESPLRPARDAILIDTTERTLDEVLELLLAHINHMLKPRAPEHE
ncbi:MAG: (d)CMP kinase [Desulfovibrionaceae bacterium]|nr:(d)CMP kinase [Desulfovibrionaceae bacterium]